MKTKLLALFLLAALPTFAASISGVWVRPCLVAKGKPCTIEWTRSGAMAGQVNITLWLAGAKQAEIADVPNVEGDNEKTWTVPADLPTGKYVFRVASTDGLFLDESEHYVDDTGLVMTKGPSGSLALGASAGIEWHAFGIPGAMPLVGDLYRNGVLVGRIIPATPSTLSTAGGCRSGAEWAVGSLIDPDTEETLAEKAPAGTGYRIRIQGQSYPGTYCESEPFAIVVPFNPGTIQNRMRHVSRIPVFPGPSCPMCGEVELQGMWKILEGSPDVQEIQLWQGGRMLGRLVERGASAQRPARRRVEFGAAFAKLRQGGAGFELRLFAAGGKLLLAQPVTLVLTTR